MKPGDEDSTVRILPLGGLGEFGMNCMLIESAETGVLIDCGVKFPEPEHFGVDLIVPDMSRLQEQPLDVLLLTHGHEDHIGAVPFLVRARLQAGMPRLPVYGGRFTLALVRRKLTEHHLLDQVELRLVEAPDVVALGDVEVEFIRVNHSIPDALALALETPVGLIVHSGDWRIDHKPVNEETTDLARFAALGQQGVRTLLSDSTNVEVPGSSISETLVADQLEDVLDLAPGRVIITQFSSNVWRLQSVLRAAHLTGRRVALLGRSMQQNAATARELGHLKVPSPDTLVDITEIEKSAPEETVLLVGGSQGEPRSSLSRIAFGEHHQIRLSESDWIVYSSRKIPGNEKRIAKVVGELHRHHAEVIVPGARALHASGHAQQEELKLLINLLKPELFVPIHGDHSQTTKHKELAESLGMRTLQISNGDVLSVRRDDEAISAHEDVAQLYVTGNSVGIVDHEVLRERRQITFSGVGICELILDSDGTILSGPRVVLCGVANDEELLAGAEVAARRALPESGERLGEADIAERLRLAVRRYLSRSISRKPVVIPLVTILRDAEE